MATKVPAIQFDPTGLTLPEELDILDGELADINTAFGGDMNTDLTTPQGQLAQSITEAIGDKNDQIAYLVNNIDPDIASGRWQDAIGRIYFIDRIAATGTVVTGRCFGLVGTVIVAGSAAQDTNGYIYYTTADFTIESNGFVDAQFQCSTPGPIACPVGNLAKVYTAVPGWDSVTNLEAGSPGTDVEGRAEFEARRRASVYLNATNTPGAIQANVLDVDGVIDAYVIDNPLSTTVTKGATNVELVQHSVWVCVAGGASEDIALAIWNRKSLGCNYNGDTEYTVYDSDGYEKPYPEYLVKWKTADPARTYVRVNIAYDPSLPAEIDALVKSAVISAFNGQDGGSRARIGSTVYAGRFYSAVSNVNANVNIQSITLALTDAADQTALSYGIDQLPTLDESDIEVVLT